MGECWWFQTGLPIGGGQVRISTVRLGKKRECGGKDERWEGGYQMGYKSTFRTIVSNYRVMILNSFGSRLSRGWSSNVLFLTLLTKKKIW